MATYLRTKSASGFTNSIQSTKRLRRAVSGVALALFAGALAGPAAPAHAQLYWDTNGATPGSTDLDNHTAPGTWGVDSFWSYDITGSSATSGWFDNEAAIFSAYNDSYPFSGNATAAYTVTVSGVQNVDSLEFDDPNVTLTGGELHLGSGFISVNGSATIASVLSGNATVMTTNVGTLTLSGANTYSGGTVINGGTVVFSDLSNLGAVPAPGTSFLTLGGGTLKYTGTANLTLDASRSISLTGAGALEIAAGSTLTYTGALSGNGGLTVKGAGTLVLASAGDYLGQTVLSGGRTILMDGAALGLSGAANEDTIVQGDNTNLTLRGGITSNESIRLTSGNGTTSGPGQLQSEGGNNVLSGILTLASTSDGMVGPVKGLATIGVDAGTSLTLTGLIQPFSSTNSGMAKVGAGTLIVGGSTANTYKGATDVFGGYLIAAKDGAFGTADKGVLMWAASPITQTVGLQSASSLNYTVAESITVAGFANDALGEGLFHNFAGSNSWAGDVILGNVLKLDNTLAPNTVGAAANSTLTILGAVKNSGSGNTTNLTKLGAGTVTLGGVNTNSGSILVADGTLSFRSKTGVANSGTWSPAESSVSSSISVISDATLTFDNTEAVDTARLAANVPVNLYRGEFSLIGNGTSNVFDLVPGGLNAYGHSTITIISPGGTTVGLSNINRMPHATMLFRSFGTLGQGAQATLSTPPALIGGGGAGSGSLPIIPWAIGDPSPFGSSGTDFVTYNASNGVRLLASTDYHTALVDNITPYNVSIDLPAAVSGTTHINSLRLTGQQPDVTLSAGAALNVQSGAIFNRAAQTVSITGGTLQFGANEAYITTLGNMTIGSVIDGTAGLAKGGAGTLSLTGSNTLTGTLSVNAGRLVFSDETNLGASNTTINLNGGHLALDSSVTDLTLSSSHGVTASSFSGGFSVAPGQTLTVQAPVSGAGALQVKGGGTVVLGAATNTYAGGTGINGATLSISTDGALGAGRQIGLNAGTLEVSSSFQMDSTRWMLLGALGGAIKVNDTALFQVPAAITGAGGLAKTGLGVLNLSGNNSYLGPTTISQGTLIVAISESLGAPASVTTLNGGTLESSHNFTSLHPTAVTSLGGIINTVGGNNVQLSNLVTAAAGANWSKTGTGALTLSGQHDFATGSTLHVQDGSLVLSSMPVAGATGTGGIAVEGSASLAGTGTLLGPVSVASGAAISPGTSAGRLTLGGLDLSAGGTYVWELGQLSTTTGFDSIGLTAGNLSLGGTSALSLNFNLLTSGLRPGNGNSFWGAAHSWKIIDLAGSATNLGYTDFYNIYGATGYNGGKFATHVLSSGVDAGDAFLDWVPIAQWLPDSGGSWGDAGNWVGGLLPVADAMFLGSPASPYGLQTAPATVTLDADRTVASITFDTTVGAPGAGYTIAPGSVNGGNNSLILDNSGLGAKIVVNSGNHAITAPVAINDLTTFTIATNSTLTLGDGSGVPTTIAAGKTLTQSGGSLVMDNLVLADDIASFRISSGNATAALISGGGNLAITNTNSTLTAAAINVAAGRGMYSTGTGNSNLTVTSLTLADSSASFSVQSGKATISGVTGFASGTGGVQVSGGQLSLSGAVTAPVRISGTGTLYAVAAPTIAGPVSASGANSTSYGLIVAGDSATPGTIAMQNGLDLSAGGAFLFKPTAITNLNQLQDLNFGTISLSAGDLTLAGSSKLKFDFAPLLSGGFQPGGADLYWTSPHSWKLIDVADGAQNAGSQTFSQFINPGSYGTWAFLSHAGTGADAGDIFLDWVALVNEWNAASGSFGELPNWTQAVPSGISPLGDAKFQGKTPAGPLVGAATVTLDASRIVSGVIFDPAIGGSSDGRYTIDGGPGSYTLNFANSGNNAKITVKSGSHAITAPVLFTDSTDISIVNSTSTLALGSASINATRAITQTGAGTLTVTNLNFSDPSASFEIRGGKAAISGATGFTSGTGGLKATGGELALSGAINTSVTVGTTVIGSPGTPVAGTLSGDATIAGPVVATASSSTNYGMIIPGSSTTPGTMTLQSGLDLSGGGAFQFKPSDLGAGFNQIILAGGYLTLGGSSKLKCDFNLLGSGLQPGGADPFWTAPHSWKLIDVADGSQNPTNLNFAQLLNAGTYSGWYFMTRVGVGSDAGDVFLDWATNEWNGVNGLFGNSAMWTSKVPTGTSPGGDAKFLGRTPSGPLDGLATVTLDASRIVSGMTFDPAVEGSSNGSYTINGNGYSLNLANSGNPVAVNVNSGSHAIAAPVFITDDTYVSITSAASTLAVSSITVNSARSLTLSGSGTMALDTLSMADGSAKLEVSGGKVTASAVTGGNVTVHNGASLKLTQKGAVGTKGVASNVASLNLDGSIGAWQGQVDVANNSLAIAGNAPTDLTRVNSQVAQGYAGGAWSGQGIVTSSAAGQTTLGVAISGANVLVKYTYIGDTNLDGVVNGSDFANMKTGYSLQGSLGRPVAFSDGDLNFDGLINGSDFAMAKTAYSLQGSPLAMSAPHNVVVPEPSTLGLLAIGAVGLLARRRRRAPASTLSR